ncbi:ATP synthase subunit d, mitochondrial [Diorhabda carinulata]|uniref:ATP synthase subunit d, mitochondrial n=1 Tax=Diorhabda sublineata TaxID=1163346 RepID=UPI0024E0697E|nr:ATP synthase subunit d, mitochondrial [Diorhabda sublineata]XP_056636217.1 ATP synthase subunit d, mitochondrial [Diorhabda sublineata]XP_056636218.1 ATP synthase subunit d, mitochondrial [Diorhabda sublineata]XP_057655126.1 ATP synthase subunit d, mitochondrial [Diorhabda carinulata]XP_057655127.1 ATP synthase subunit d, mitochondrial [Diorhabda carinulata]
MATRRITKSSINWLALSERVPEHQRAQYLAFKAKSDGYLRRVMSNPEQAPAIDWAFYKSKVPVAGMVDEFQKQYSALSIPYPPDTIKPQLDSLEKEIKSDIEKFKSESNTRIAEYKKQLAHIASLIPYDQMTMEDYRDAYPEDALDPINRPTFWPHTPEEQIDYVDKDAQPHH